MEKRHWVCEERRLEWQRLVAGGFLGGLGEIADWRWAWPDLAALDAIEREGLDSAPEFARQDFLLEKGLGTA